MSKPVHSGGVPPAGVTDLQFATSIAEGSSADASNHLFNNHISLDNRHDPIQKRKNACQFDDCRRIVPIAMRDVRCRCEKVFCLHHLSTPAHHCTFDWRSHDLERLRSANSKISKHTSHYEKYSGDHAY